MTESTVAEALSPMRATVGPILRGALRSPAERASPVLAQPLASEGSARVRGAGGGEETR